LWVRRIHVSPPQLVQSLVVVPKLNDLPRAAMPALLFRGTIISSLTLQPHIVCVVGHTKRKPGWLARLLLRRVGCGYITARRDWR
jgi:hypothetical protein